MGFTEKNGHDEDGETTQARMRTKEASNNENFRRNERNSGDSPYVRAKWMISARRDFDRIIIETQSGHVAQICTQM